MFFGYLIQGVESAVIYSRLAFGGVNKTKKVTVSGNLFGFMNIVNYASDFSGLLRDGFFKVNTSFWFSLSRSAIRISPL